MFTIKNNVNSNSIFTILLVLMPIFNVYSAYITNKLGLGTFIIFIFCIITFKNTILSFSINNINMYYWYYLLYSIFLTITVAILSKNSTLNSYILIIIFYSVIMFVYVPKYFNLELAKKLYFFVCFGASFFLIIQILIFTYNDVVLPGIIKKIPLYSFEDNIYYLEMNEMFLRYNMFRPSSFFTEPSHFALYVVPCINILLYNKIVKHYLLFSIFFSLVVVLTYSANGLVLVVGTWILWFIYIKKIHYKSKLFVCITLLLVILLLIVYKNIYFENLYLTYQRLLLVLTSDISSSDYLRIFRGFTLFNQLGVFDKFIGIGYGDVKNLIMEYNLIDYYDLEIYDYMSSISRIFLSTGICGFIIYFIFIINIYKKSSNYKYLILILSIIFLSTSTLYSHYSLLIYSFVIKDALVCQYGYKRNNQEERSKQLPTVYQ